MRATVTEVPATENATGPGYSIQGFEDLKYTYSFVDNVFDQKKEDLASYYQKWGRVLCVLDENLNELYGPSIKACKLSLRFTLLYFPISSRLVLCRSLQQK